MFRKRRRIFPFFIFFLVTAVLVFSASFVRPLVMSVANTHLKNTAVRIINTAVLKNLSDGSADYSDIVTMSKDANERVSALSVNFSQVNKIKAGLTLDILNGITKSDRADIAIPLGNFFSNEFMWGTGPKIPFKIMPNPTVDVNFRDDFTSAGVNQTVHKIYLDVDANVSAAVPAVKTGARVKTSFLIAQTVIVGEVPETYTGINEIPGSIEDYILDVTP